MIRSFKRRPLQWEGPCQNLRSETQRLQTWRQPEIRQTQPGQPRLAEPQGLPTACVGLSGNPIWQKSRPTGRSFSRGCCLEVTSSSGDSIWEEPELPTGDPSRSGPRRPVPLRPQSVWEKNLGTVWLIIAASVSTVPTAEHLLNPSAVLQRRA